MTVPSTVVRKKYTANGVTTAFAYPGNILAATDLSVYLVDTSTTPYTTTLQNYSTDYTLTGVLTSSGGNVVFGTAPASGSLVIILRNDVSREQGKSLTNQGSYDASVIEQALDRLSMVDLWQEDEISRAVRAPDTETPIDMELPDAATRADKLLSFDITGKPSVTTPSSGSAASNALGIDYDPTGTGAVATSAQARLRREVWIEDYLPVGFNADTDDATAALTAAVAALPQVGGTVKFSRGYLMNYVHTGNGVTFEGVASSLYNHVDGIQHSAYDTTKYAFELGDGVNATYGTTLRNMSFYAKAGTEQYGLNINGAFGFEMWGVSSRGFTKRSLNITSTAAQPTTYGTFFGGFIISGNVAGASALYMSYGGSYTTAVNFVGTNFSYAALADRTLILDGVTVGFTDCWCQLGDLQGVKLLNSAKIVGKDLTLDSDLSTDRLIEFDIASTTADTLTNYLKGSISIDGKVYFSDAVSVTLGWNSYNYNNAFHFGPVVAGSTRYFLDGATLADQDYGNVGALPRVYVDSTGRYITDMTGASAAGEIRDVLPAGGAHKVLVASGGAYYILSNGTATAQLFMDGTGNLRLYPQAGQAVVLGSATTDKIAAFGGGGAVQQAITGALSSVTDANAKAVLTSIINALAAYNLVSDTTT